MFDRTLVDQAAATLAGLKPASMFPYCVNDLEKGKAEIEYWSSRLLSVGIEISILCQCRKRNRMLIYVYRRSALENTLSCPFIRDFLKNEGYDINSGTDGILLQLKDRVVSENGFPHETGVFLGYPLEDVTGFIENRGQNCRFCGFWKAYGDPVNAERQYRMLKSCRDRYKELFESGITVMELAAAA